MRKLRKFVRFSLIDVPVNCVLGVMLLALTIGIVCCDFLAWLSGPVDEAEALELEKQEWKGLR